MINHGQDKHMRYHIQISQSVSLAVWNRVRVMSNCQLKCITQSGSLEYQQS